MTRPLGGLYVHTDPTDGRIRLVCTRCDIDRIELSYPAAIREAKEHRAWHDTWKAAA
jgi:hypothetical protein